MASDTRPGPSKSQRAYDWLRQRIGTQEFSPGYRLVLASIAEELGMSVVPVREAIRQLQAEGLVTFERNVGARVARLDDANYRDTMQTISVLESAATALASRNLTADDLRRARAVNEAMVECLDQFNPRAFSALNQQFHYTLYSRCANPHLLALVESEWAQLRQLSDTVFAFVPDRARESVGEHDDIMALIERSAPLDDIERAVREHRNGTLAAYLSHDHATPQAG